MHGANNIKKNTGLLLNSRAIGNIIEKNRPGTNPSQFRGFSNNVSISCFQNMLALLDTTKYHLKPVLV
jgi:hypothetical protein